MLIVACVIGCSNTTPGSDAGIGADAGERDGRADAETDAGADAGALPDAEPLDLGTMTSSRTVVVLDRARIGSDSSQANFQHARGELRFDDGPYAEAILHVSLESTCFPFSSWAQNPPPPGQNWPADCDAFDRNFEIALDPRVMPSDPPELELVRSITPFGGPLEYDVDITDVANGLPGAHRLDVLISTYSDGAGQVSGSNGGWNVSVAVRLTPGPAPRNVLKIQPIFDLWHDSNTGVSTATVTTPEGTTEARIEYRATGHGGAPGDGQCIGPAEEFCRRTHGLFVDGVREEGFDAWRSDCANNCTVAHQGSGAQGFDYCLENPCGNMASVRAPRANWCPGTITPPHVLSSLRASTPGSHRISYRISTVAPGGGWRISATYFAYGD